jgi:hypothetical protein
MPGHPPKDTEEICPQPPGQEIPNGQYPSMESNLWRWGSVQLRLGSAAFSSQKEVSLASCDAEAVGEEMTPELSVMTNISRAGREPKPLPLVGDPRF